MFSSLLQYGKSALWECLAPLKDYENAFRSCGCLIHVGFGQVGLGRVGFVPVGLSNSKGRKKSSYIEGGLDQMDLLCSTPLHDFSP